MSKMEEMCRRAKIVPSRRQLYAAEYLEYWNKRFGIDFSLSNCEERAIGHWFSGLIQRESFVLRAEINQLSQYFKERL